MQKIKTNLKFYRTNTGKSTFRTQNDSDSANFRYTAYKISFVRLSVLDTKYIILHQKFFQTKMLSEKTFRPGGLPQPRYGPPQGVSKHKDLMEILKK